jgi:Bacterial TSP3 repeat
MRTMLTVLALVTACSNSPASTADGGLPPPEPERLAALRDLPAPWVARTQMANLYDGTRVYVRNRMAGATGPSTRANTRPTLVVLGNRSGSRGPDADRDGISDEAERAIGTDPAAFDTDGDGVPDAFELFGTGTNPRVADSDRDGMADGAELNLDDARIYADDDGDGFPNSQERASLGSDPSSRDSDGDGVDDRHEFFFGTAMNDRTRPDVDTDGDGEPDDFEAANGTDPRAASSQEPDADGDDIPDWLDDSSLMMARVSGRRAAVPAGQSDSRGYEGVRE